MKKEKKKNNSDLYLDQIPNVHERVQWKVEILYFSPANFIRMRRHYPFCFSECVGPAWKSFLLCNGRMLSLLCWVIEISSAVTTVKQSQTFVPH